VPGEPTRRSPRGGEPEILRDAQEAGPRPGATAVPPAWLEEPRPTEWSAGKAIGAKARSKPESEPRPEPGRPGHGLVHWNAGVSGAAASDARGAKSDVSSWDLGRVAAAAAGEPAPAVGPLPDTGEFAWGDRAVPPDAPPAAVARAEVHRRRAPPWRRVLAWAVDVGPLAAGVFVLGRSLLGSAAAALPAPADGLDGLIDLVAREGRIVLSLLALLAVALAVYTTLAHALAGATLGKWMFGLRVVGPQGTRPSLGRSAARSALAVLSAALLGLGFLLALFTRSGRALHDFLARTWVVEA
jgi:resuscitation-promoting factor RpfA